MTDSPAEQKACQQKKPLWAEREQVLLAPYAMFSVQSKGRQSPEPLHPYRSPFQRDRDRILHSSAFRRLSGKMQVFTGDMGDYHRTRLTHTHEVSTIARTIGRVLRLNEDLIEALALLHDIGHPPFGHSGEDVLNRCLHDQGGFSHNQFALTLVEELEKRYTPYPGLNLSREILEGQVFRITHQAQAPLLEVQVVDWADSIAYNAHDADDALKLGLLRMEQLEPLDLVQRALASQANGQPDSSPVALRQRLVHQLIDVQVVDLLDSTRKLFESIVSLDRQTVQEQGVHLHLSPKISEERKTFARFLFDNVYRHPELIAVREVAASQVRELFEFLTGDRDRLPSRFQLRAETVGLARAAGEYIGGMTDRFFHQQYRQLVIEDTPAATDWD